MNAARPDPRTDPPPRPTPSRTARAARDDRDDRADFAATFDELSPRVYGYAARRCSPADAQDVVAETFTTAWRRWRDVPTDALPWLLVVARNIIANSRRSQVRRDRLTVSVTALARLAGPAAAPDQSVIERDALLAGLRELTDLEREALLLVAWDALSNRDAAAVAGCSLRAFEVRLSRARARLTRAVDAPADDETADDLAYRTER